MNRSPIIRIRRAHFAMLSAGALSLCACGASQSQSRLPLEPADTISPPSTNPSKTYESYGPGPEVWLPLTASIPSTVAVGDTIIVSGSCDLAMVGEPAGISWLLPTPTANDPSQWDWAATFGWTEFSPSVVQPDGSFTQTVVASVLPGTYFIGPSCASEAWIDDALYPDGNGGTIIRYYGYPDELLRAIEVVTQPPASTGDGTATIPGAS